MARRLTQSQLAMTHECSWCNKHIINSSNWNSSHIRSGALKRAEVQHYEWAADFLEEHVPGEVSVVHSILEYLFPVVYGHDAFRPFFLQSHTEKHYHIECLSIACSTKSGRRSNAPRRFEDLSFVKGSGVSGCDRFETEYNRGHFWDSEKFSPDLERNPDSNFIVGDDFDEVESLPSDEEECDYDSSSEEEEWEESDYDSE